MTSQSMLSYVAIMYLKKKKGLNWCEKGAYNIQIR